MKATSKHYSMKSTCPAHNPCNGTVTELACILLSNLMRRKATTFNDDQQNNQCARMVGKPAPDVWKCYLFILLSKRVSAVFGGLVVAENTNYSGFAGCHGLFPFNFDAARSKLLVCEALSRFFSHPHFTHGFRINRNEPHYINDAQQDITNDVAPVAAVCFFSTLLLPLLHLSNWLANNDEHLQNQLAIIYYYYY